MTALSKGAIEIAETDYRKHAPEATRMGDERKEIRGDVVQGAIMGDVKKVKQDFGPEHPVPPTRDDDVPKRVWIPALAFTSLLLLFLMAAFFLTPTLTPDQRNILHLLFCPTAGFATHFLGGTVLLKLQLPMGKKGKLALSATAGIAVFIFTYLQPPFWFVGS